MTATPLVGSTFFGIDISQLGEQLSSMRRRVSKRVLVLEFGTDLLHLAEACLTQQGVQLNHISSVALPPEALDRGVPAEPAKMASLIQQICTEKKIPAHRVAVVLPPEVAFQRLVDLPGELTTEEAREYVLDPAKGVQLPFPLAQTDFDLVPMSTPSIAQRAPGMRLYMLSAVPQVLVDRVIEMLQAADLELQLLELGSLSQLRSLALDLVMLAPHQVELVLELHPDCSNLMLVTCSGLLGSERLAAIRDFPEPDLDEEQTRAALEAGLSAESFTVQDESYLPISDLDLRVLIADLKAALARFNGMFPGAEIRCLQLTGLNSAHPMLVDLLQQALGLNVLAHRPLLAPGVAGFAADEVLVQKGLGRLVGLALGLLNRDQLVTFPVDSLDDGVSRPHRPGVAIEELLDLDVQSSSLDQLPVVADQSVSVRVQG
ncbi:type IV pilus biogenesis protein PilM [Synechococcus sp. UW140]|uniref:type IV pilus biogenesis protein PilM n=1 Tax=Synechococcus sp. UW140 TaxID=368503 RepID=UPI000E0EB7A0|nr:pilus assembly protein PilM [Synechococcus sp. UW140]